jgi:DNA-binding SARP family transcriptional activator/tetratricopeptide (TPR) repeat protein
MPPILQIQLLGKFNLAYDAVPVTGLNTPRLQSLFAYLVLHRDAPQPRRQIAFCLWPDLPEDRARANLRKLFYQLQRALPNAAHFLYADKFNVQWQPTVAVGVDVAEFEAQAALATGLSRALELYRGDLLPDCYDDWIVPERERLKQVHLDMLEHLIRQREAGQDYAAALSLAQQLLHRDPLREEVQRHVMRLHVLNGDRAAALRAYQNCVTVLQRELGVEPGPVTRQVYEQLLDYQQPLLTTLPLTGALGLVGRTAEWTRLQTTWRSAALGCPQLVLITGEAGIGKTRLAEELLIWADRQGIAVSSTHCYAAEGALAYAPITNWLRERPLTHLEPIWLSEVARLAPELGSRSAGAAPAGPLIEPWQRQRFREALARAVLGPDLATSVPVLLLIEDIQWCDCDTLEWLHYLLRLNPRARLLLVCTLRSEAVRQDCALDELLADLRRQSLLTEIDLKPLTETETAALAKQVLGQEIAAAAGLDLWRETEGNPLFVVEFARAGLITPAEVATAEVHVLPPLVQAVVSARLAQLPPTTHQLMELAAVIGREFTFEVLARVSGEDEEALVQALDELWRRRIIRERGKDAYDFSHDKLRQVAYGQLSSTRRRRLHRKVAVALSQLPADRVGQISGQIGWHYEQAGDDPLAAQWLHQAGAAAAQVGALPEALAYFERALLLTLETNLAERYSILLAREKIYHLQAARPDQAHDLATLETLAVAMNDPSKQAQVAVERGHYWLETSQFAAALEAAQLALNEIGQVKDRHTLSVSQPIDLIRLEFAAYDLWAATLLWQGECQAASVQAEHALTLARTAGLRREEARALLLLADAFTNQPEGSGYLEAAWPIYREVGDQVGECTCLQLLGYALLYEDEYDRAGRCYEQALHLAQQIGFRGGVVDALYRLGHLHNQLGDYPGGKRYLEQAAEMAREDQNRRRLAYCLFNLAVSYQGLQQFKLAFKHVREALTICLAVGDGNAEENAWMLQGGIFIDLEQWAKAATAYRQAWRCAEAVSDVTGLFYLRAKLAYILLKQGQVRQAQDYVDEVLAFESRHGSLRLTDEGPVVIYLHCWKVLHAVDDPRDDRVLDVTYAVLQQQLAHISDETLRKTFLQNKRENRELIEARHSLGNSGGLVSRLLQAT